MPDTIRTLADLNQRFADNTSGVISPQDIRDLMVSMMVYAEIGSGAKAGLTLGASFQAMDFNLAGTVSRGLTVDTTNKWIADVPVTMKATVGLEVHFQGASQATPYEFAVFRNPDASPIQLQRVSSEERIFNVNQRGKVCIAADVQLQAGDKLQAAVRCNGQSFTLLRGRLWVRRIGVE